MAGNHFVFLMLLQWTLVGGGICKQNVKGVLHGRVELHTCHELQQNVKSVEWFKHRNSTSHRLLYRFEQPNDLTSYSPSQNIQFNEDNMSLIFVNLTKEDEGVYLNRIVPGSDSNKAVTKQCNITLSVLSPPSALRIAVATSNYTLTLRCEVRGQFLNLRWLRNGLLLPDDQRISISENNMTVHVSNLKNSDRGTYTCQVSNLHGTSETHVNITGENTPLWQDSIEKEELSTKFQYFTGLACILAMLLSIILFCICRNEYGYEKFISSQAETSEVEFLPCLYADFIKPKALQQAADEGQLVENLTKVFYNTAIQASPSNHRLMKPQV